MRFVCNFCLFTFVLIGILVIPGTGSGQAATWKEDFCSRSPEQVQAAAGFETENRLAFRNRGGLLNGGVCWWHSRFQRAALYLAIFRPDLPKPSARVANRSIRALTAMRVTVIPGFNNLHEFSDYYSDEIQKILEEWQVRDGILGFRWVDGLVGVTEKRASSLRSAMDKLYERVGEKHEIVFQKLQLVGIDAHAWLVIDMKPTENGYSLRYNDSNFPDRTKEYNYNYGMTSMYYFYDPMIPYNDYDMDLWMIRKSIERFCRGK